mmetsp:Transcript_24269/g.58577  ORF Transcript_24269/g.58577 Transcript_24269/m.58577 type:complete len:201 (-) Transcript_24269:117-719(-)
MFNPEGGLEVRHGTGVLDEASHAAILAPGVRAPDVDSYLQVAGITPGVTVAATAPPVGFATGSAILYRGDRNACNANIYFDVPTGTFDESRGNTPSLIFSEAKGGAPLPGGRPAYVSCSEALLLREDPASGYQRLAIPVDALESHLRGSAETEGALQFREALDENWGERTYAGRQIRGIIDDVCCFFGGGGGGGAVRPAA